MLYSLWARSININFSYHFGTVGCPPQNLFGRIKRLKIECKLVAMCSMMGVCLCDLLHDVIAQLISVVAERGRTMCPNSFAKSAVGN